MKASFTTWLLFLLFVVTFQGSLFSQNARFYLQSDKSEAVAGTTFRLEAVLENMDADNIVLADIHPFKVVQGPSRASSLSIINGKKSESLTYSWLVKAPDKGLYTIPPATAKIGSRTFSSNTLRITVAEASAIQAKTQGGEDLFVRLVTTTKTAFPGQQVAIDLVLYTAVEVAMYQVLNTFETKGLFIKIAEKTDFPTQRVVLGGKDYYAKVLRRYFVFPQKTGTFQMNALQVSAQVMSGPSMGFSIFGDSYQKELISNPLELTVNEIPTGAPDTFSGAVGDYTISFSTQNQSVPKGGTAVLKLYIEGDGDPKKCKNPVIKAPFGLDAYDPIIKRDEWVEQGGRLRMFREVEYTFVPVIDTVYTFVPVFNFFSTGTNRYEDVRGDTITWKIGPAIEANSGGQDSKQSALDEDDHNTAWNIAIAFVEGTWKYMLAVMLLLFIVYKVRNKGRNSITAANEKTEPVGQQAMAKLHLDAARVYQKTGSTDSFLKELNMAVSARLQELISENLGCRSRAEVLELLAQYGFSQKITDQYIRISHTIDQFRFGGAASGVTDIWTDVHHFLLVLDNEAINIQKNNQTVQ